MLNGIDIKLKLDRFILALNNADFRNTLPVKITDTINRNLIYVSPYGEIFNNTGSVREYVVSIDLIDVSNYVLFHDANKEDVIEDIKDELGAEISELNDEIDDLRDEIDDYEKDIDRLNNEHEGRILEIFDNLKSELIESTLEFPELRIIEVEDVKGVLYKVFDDNDEVSTYNDHVEAENAIENLRIQKIEGILDRC